MARGRLITLEGIEGVGKSTHVEFIVGWLQARHVDVHVTREPGGTELGEALRDLILATAAQPMQPLAELLLMFAARAEHLAQVIVPRLEAGAWVVSDRFTDASYAYQGGGRGIDNTVIESLENIVQGSLRPDLTLLLDADPDVALRRTRERGDVDRFEQETLAFFNAVRAAYLSRATAEPERIRVLDANRPLTTVQEQLDAQLSAWWT